MPAKEIKALRQAGKLEEALVMARAELHADPENIWTKRNISWVFYDYLKLKTSPDHFDNFLSWLVEIKNLRLPAEEKMLFDKLTWQIGKMCFALIKSNATDVERPIRLFETVQSFNFPSPSEGYSFLFKAFHKSFKNTYKYIAFADWWNFQNFFPADFQKERLPDGKEVMAIAEQAYITYAKHLLPKHTNFGETIFDRDKTASFLPILSDIAENYPQFQYPAYFKAKLLLALGDKDDILSTILPFAKKKQNDFWVWEILAEAFSSDPEKVFACYCRALTCKSPEEMLVGLRQKMASILITKNLYNEARTEIELLIAARKAHEYKIPNEVANWRSQGWYSNATVSQSNITFYRKYTDLAESLLFSDVPEETVIVEFVNTDKKMLNFIASEEKFGFFKYDRFLKDVKIGNTLSVRFQGGSNEGIHQLYTARKVNDEDFKKRFLKEVEGELRVPPGKPFGFLGDVFVHPSIVSKLQLVDHAHLKGMAIRSYNQERKQWGWKFVEYGLR